ncbi:hypothetical protein LL253_12740 [Sphingobium soli]|jgi:hypothetical protein|uniref:Uncharacterized protein n=1 Tax=Sphingobium soli TaxID=1591116 RepID=A0ABS8H7D1_9SPHN|nr:hypothetical protein [Sphingobium soli]|tara:strand:- start:543 stop:791 length:249 start_codon:yes stop_codon:yes gene_type:complete
MKPRRHAIRKECRPARAIGRGAGKHPVLKENLRVCCIGRAGQGAGPHHPHRHARYRGKRGWKIMPHAASTCSVSPAQQRALV